MMLISYAQNFEDVILWRALKHVENGFYVDLGAQDPVVDSVSLAFYEKGWRGVHVEPVAAYAEALRASRPDEEVVQAAIGNGRGQRTFYEIPKTGLSTGDLAIAEQHAMAGFQVKELSVPLLRLGDLLDRYADRELHWLKIDVEGMEAEVIESWSPSEVRPWVVVVESTVPNYPEPSFRWEPKLRELGYKFAYFDGLNRFYVSRAHLALCRTFGPGPNCFDDFSLSEMSSFGARLRENRAALEVQLGDERSLTAALRGQLEAERSAKATLEVQLGDERSLTAALNRQLAADRSAEAELEVQLGEERSLTAVLNRQLHDLKTSVSHILRSRAALYLNGVRAWATLRPGSRPRRAGRQIILFGGRYVQPPPTLAEFAKRLLEPHPEIRNRLRLMLHHPRPAPRQVTAIADHPLRDQLLRQLRAEIKAASAAGGD